MRLLALSRFADDSESILAAVQGQTFMSIESGGNLGVGLGLDQQSGFELRTATLAHCKEVWGRFHDAELPFCHDSSLPLRQTPVDFKRHHYRNPNDPPARRMNTGALQPRAVLQVTTP